MPLVVVEARLCELDKRPLSYRNGGVQVYVTKRREAYTAGVPSAR